MRAQVSLAVAVVVLVSLYGGAAEAQTPARFLRASGPIVAAAVADGARPRVMRTQPMAVHLPALPSSDAALAALRATRLEIELFDGRVVTVALDRADAGLHGTIYTGIVEGAADSRFAGVRVDDAFVADLAVDGEFYELRFEGPALRLQQIDPTVALACEELLPPPAVAGQSWELGVGSRELPVSQPLGEPTTVEVLWAFTTAAEAGAGGASAAQALAELTIQNVNAALARSQVAASFRLVGVMATAVTEFGEYVAELARVQSPTDGVMDDVPVRRDQLQADLVVFVVEGFDSGGSAGRGYLLSSFSKSGHPFGYSINQRQYISTYLVGHEMGHNLGLHHDRANTGGGTPFRPYAYGHQQANNFYTIMAYACGGCRQIDYYSNPNVLYNGVPTGIADFTDEARALRENFPAVAAFRGCVATVAAEDPPADGGPFGVSIQIGSGCLWTFSPSAATWLTPPPGVTTGYGPTILTMVAAPLPQGTAQRTATVFVDGMPVTVTQRPAPDTDGDGLPDPWETQFGLNPASSAGNDGPTGDPDNDGVTNAQERANGTHPRGFHTRYLAEGSSNAFFRTRLAVFNATNQGGSALLRFRQPGRAAVNAVRALAANQRLTVSPETVPGLDTDFATVIESSVPVVVDRTMMWDGTGYGSHAETSLASPSTTWYLAEGSTSGAFTLFYLLQNPGPLPTDVTIRYLRPFGVPPIDRTYSLAADSRLTIPVDDVAPELASTDVSAVVTSVRPIIVERAMYLNAPGQPFAAGHESAGVTAPATSWFLAEGATGTFFDLFILLSNPSTSRAEIDVDYLLSTGATFRKHYSLAPQSRSTIWVDDEQVPAGSGTRPFANVNVSATVTSTNAVPIIVERTMWWPGPELTPNYWREAHNSAGATASGTVWALAEGEQGGTQNAETFVLIANTTPAAGDVRVTLYFEDGTTAERTLTLRANSRTTVNVSADFPAAANKRFGTRVESLGASPVQIVVERAMYTSPGGQTWAAGTNALATKLQ
jgi:hypothetical protein